MGHDANRAADLPEARRDGVLVTLVTVLVRWFASGCCRGGVWPARVPTNLEAARPAGSALLEAARAVDACGGGIEVGGVPAAIPFLSVLSNPLSLPSLLLRGGLIADSRVEDPVLLVRLKGLPLAGGVFLANAMVIIKQYTLLPFSWSLYHDVASRFGRFSRRASATPPETVVRVTMSAAPAGFLVALDPRLAIVSFPSLGRVHGGLRQLVTGRQAPWNRAEPAFMYESRPRPSAKTIICFEGKRVGRTSRSVRPTRWLGNEPLRRMGGGAALPTRKSREWACSCPRGPQRPERRQLVSPFRLLESRDHR